MACLWFPQVERGPSLSSSGSVLFPPLSPISPSTLTRFFPHPSRISGLPLGPFSGRDIPTDRVWVGRPKQSSRFSKERHRDREGKSVRRENRGRCTTDNARWATHCAKPSIGCSGTERCGCVRKVETRRDHGRKKTRKRNEKDERNTRGKGKKRG